MKRSQTLQLKQAAKLLEKSEHWLMQALDGNKELKDKEIASIAMNIVSKRLPAIDKDMSGNRITMVKIVKNHLPDNSGDTVDVKPMKGEVIEAEVIKDAKEELNEKLAQLRANDPDLKEAKESPAESK